MISRLLPACESERRIGARTAEEKAERIWAWERRRNLTDPLPRQHETENSLHLVLHSFTISSCRRRRAGPADKPADYYHCGFTAGADASWGERLDPAASLPKSDCIFHLSPSCFDNSVGRARWEIEQDHQLQPLHPPEIATHEQDYEASLFSTHERASAVPSDGPIPGPLKSSDQFARLALLAGTQKRTEATPGL